jgi:hypothetical protein
LDEASFQLKTLSFHIVTTTGYAFSQAMNMLSGGDPLSHSWDGGVVVRDILSS